MKRIRRSTLLCLLIGVALTCWGLTYSGYVPPLLAFRWQIKAAITWLGSVFLIYGFVKLFQQKGDYDNFDDPGDEDDDNSPKKSSEAQ